MVMGARLNDLAALEHMDDIAVCDGGQAVRDEDCGAVLGNGPERPQNVRLRERVQGGRGLVAAENPVEMGQHLYLSGSIIR